MTTSTTAPEGVDAPSPGPMPSRTDAIVEAWFNDHFRNLSGLSGHLWNHFREAADRLKARLRAEEK